jgi:hypothetical protein
MEISPISGIRATGPATVSRDEREVPPTFALDPSGRLGDDAYNSARQETERGLEEKDSEEVEESDEPSEIPSILSDPKSQVSFFA